MLTNRQFSLNELKFGMRLYLIISIGFGVWVGYLISGIQ